MSTTLKSEDPMGVWPTVEGAMDQAPLPLSDMFMGLTQTVPWTSGNMVWACNHVKGKGSAIFLSTLGNGHRGKGRGPTGHRTPHYNRAKGEWEQRKQFRHALCVSTLARDVWNNLEQRKKWLAFHKAATRLTGSKEISTDPQISQQ